jgi:peptidoglycan hydrolase CwlO-like protein
LTEEKDAIYSSLANAEAYIEQLLAENKNIQQKIQSQPQPAVNTVAESAKVQSLTQELTETQNRLKAAEGEVQRIKKEL